MVGVDREHEAEALESFVALCAQDDVTVDELMCRCELDAISDPEGRRELPVADVTRRVVGVPDAVRERVRSGRPDDALDRQPFRAASTSAFRPRSAARCSTELASYWRPHSRRNVPLSKEAS